MERDGTPERPDASVPSDVSDPDLWLAAVDLAARHAPDPTHPDRCANPDCSDPQPYPCFARRLADASALRSRRVGPVHRPDRHPANGGYRSQYGSADTDGRTHARQFQR